MYHQLNRLKAERLVQGLTQQDLARRAGLPPRLVHGIEIGRINPRPEELTCIARVLNVWPAELLLRPAEIVRPEKTSEAEREVTA